MRVTRTSAIEAGAVGRKARIVFSHCWNSGYLTNQTERLGKLLDENNDCCEIEIAERFFGWFADLDPICIEIESREMNRLIYRFEKNEN